MPTDNTFLSGLSAKPGDSFFLFYLNRKKKKKGEEKEWKKKWEILSFHISKMINVGFNYPYVFEHAILF